MAYTKDKDLRQAASNLYIALDHISRLAAIIHDVDILSDTCANVDSLAAAITAIANKALTENEI